MSTVMVNAFVTGSTGWPVFIISIFCGLCDLTNLKENACQNGHMTNYRIGPYRNASDSRMSESDTGIIASDTKESVFLPSAVTWFAQLRCLARCRTHWPGSSTTPTWRLEFALHGRCNLPSACCRDSNPSQWRRTAECTTGWSSWTRCWQCIKWLVAELNQLQVVSGLPGSEQVMLDGHVWWRVN